MNTYIHRYILVQKSDSEVIMATVASVFIQEIDELVYVSLRPAHAKSRRILFETPPYTNKHTLDYEKQASQRYRNVKGLERFRLLCKGGTYLNRFGKLPFLVGAAVAFVIGARRFLAVCTYEAETI
jgi:hypothetical protein